jgi:uncharacterized membrane protein
MPSDSHAKLAPLALSKGRIEALSDGVFAIAMTLLVLELKIPDLPKETTQAELLLKLKELLPHFYSYAMTFILAGVFWLFHHFTYHFIRHTTRALLWMNIIFLMFVSLLPFSTHFMADFMRQPVALMFYFGNQTVLALLLRVQWIYARQTGILEIKTDERWGRRFPIRVNVLMLACAAAFVTAYFRPRVSQNVFLFALIGGLLFERIYNRRAADLLSKKAVDAANTA